MGGGPQGSQDVTRKRPRSTTSSDSSTTYKRGASEDAIASAASTPSATVTPSVGMDAYMREQDKDDVCLPGDTITRGNDPIASSSKPMPIPSEQLTLIESLVQRTPQPGETWYIISRGWYQKWHDACSGRISKTISDPSTIPLGPIQNDAIVGADGTLRMEPALQEGEDIEYLPDQAWKLLVEWYGSPMSIFPRPVNKRGLIEVNPRTLRIFYTHTDPTHLPPTRKIYLLREDTFADIIPRITWNDRATLHRIDVDQPWEDDTPLNRNQLKNMKPVHILGPNPDQAALSQSVDDKLEFSMGDLEDFVVDLTPAESEIRPVAPPPPIFGSSKDFFSKFEIGSKGTNQFVMTNGVTSGSPRLAIARSIAPTRTPGTMGLTNLGNTCFMNSALQCLAHVPELTEYFVRGVYMSELNPDNPLSTGGALARSYGDLLRNLFAPNTTSTCYTPREFKHRIAMHAPAFAGYQQHDSQELLAFLLDGLHEDLNRILKKPYVEKPDWEGGDLKDLVKLAKATWEGYLKRNDSAIVDLFQGQYKSTLVCPVCSKVSITFDPFMYLTLPLPVHKLWRHEVSFIPWDIQKPHISVRVEVPANSSIRALKQLLAKWFQTEADRLLAADYFRFRFYKIYSDHESVGEITSNDKTYIYELPISVRQPHSKRMDATNDVFIIPVYHILPPPTESYRGGFRSVGLDNRLYGAPFFVCLENVDGTAPPQEDIYAAILERYTHWTDRASHLYDWHHTDSETETDTEMEPATPTADEESSTPNGDAFQDTLMPSSSSSGLSPSQDSTSTGRSEDIAPTRAKPSLFRFYIRETISRLEEIDVQLMDFGRGRDVEISARALTSLVTEDSPVVTEISEETLEPVQRIRLRVSDAFVVEWDPQMLLYFFGADGKGEEARWDKFEPYVDPETLASQQRQAAEAAHKKKRPLNLDDCLDEFTKEERLGEDDLWYCPRCKEHRQATKKFEIWKLPDILVVHLKRFSNSRLLRDKIDAIVEFPIEGLDLENRVEERRVAKELQANGGDLAGTGLEHALDEPLIYDLFAVDEHIGGLGGGHYRAYAKNDVDRQWYHFDDSYTSNARPEDSVNANAYLLFYRRRSSKPLGGATYEKLEAARSAASDEISYPTEEPAATEPTASTSRTFLGPFIGPVLPDRTSTPEVGFEETLPSFEESIFDPVAIPRSDNDAIFPGYVDDRRAPSPSSSLDVDRDSSDLVGGSESDGSPRFSVGVGSGGVSRLGRSSDWGSESYVRLGPTDISDDIPDPFEGETEELQKVA
ncbi:uncharacterized protein EI90DRAFT_3076907 [Cantharellus anzutake]|uniref:uncharacterized protein n=1 Tax=Cantharellus anzutake TaxID=1750568 RepID=UPI001908E6EB|nr:uncharacterized protein EI90DRAFT_3076907 [Cantharellus anzutake]KAF8323520.1 hypothetical protein EI90DRAFT_3076907 [Cantharellus anzutake]